MAISQKPFTAIVEDVMLEVRENSTEVAVERKYQRRVNDIYVRDLLSKDFDFLRTTNNITLSAAYSTGTVAITAGDTAVAGTSTVWTTSHTGMKMKITGNDEIYTFTRTGGTTGTISPALTGSTTYTAATYIIFQDTYSLALDFDRLVIPPGFYYDYNSSKVSLSPKFNKDWYRTWTTTSTEKPTSYRVFGRASSNLYWQVQVMPPITASRILSYEYIPLYSDMTEYITGTCATAAGDATVTGTGTDFVNNVSAGDAFRLDSVPNDWYLVSSVTDGTHLELTANYPSTKTTTAYTICKVPKTPVQLQQAIFYGACYLSSQDQDNDSAAKNYYNLYKKSVDDYMSIENKGKRGRQIMKVKDLYR